MYSAEPLLFILNGAICHTYADVLCHFYQTEDKLCSREGVGIL